MVSQLRSFAGKVDTRRRMSPNNSRNLSLQGLYSGQHLLTGSRSGKFRERERGQLLVNSSAAPLILLVPIVRSVPPCKALPGRSRPRVLVGRVRIEAGAVVEVQNSPQRFRILRSESPRIVRSSSLNGDFISFPSRMLHTYRRCPQTRESQATGPSLGLQRLLLL
jgi:hypothetical protein